MSPKARRWSGFVPFTKAAHCTVTHFRRHHVKCKISPKLKALHQSFLDANSCAEKNRCTECLRDPTCNWCTSPSYSHADGSPLPRCNSDDYFTSYLCPEEGILNPSQALGEDESCDSCDHCAGGVCQEDKEVVLHDIADTD